MKLTTRLIEDTDHYYWECEKCGNTFCFNFGTPQENKYNYCCNCGRKITEYVRKEA